MQLVCNKIDKSSCCIFNYISSDLHFFKMNFK